MLAGVALLAAVATPAGRGSARCPSSTAADAVSVAEDALAAGGVDAIVDPAPGSGTYTTSAGQDVDVWKVLAEVGGDLVAVWVARDDGQPVFLDDRAPGGAGQVLSESAVTAVGAHRDNPAFDRHLRRNLVVTAAAVLLAVVAVQAAARLPAHRRPAAP